MMLIQYLGIIFAVFALSRVFLRWRDKSVPIGELIVWCVVWGAVIAISAFPGIFTWLSMMLGIGRGVDILLYIGMIVIFYLMFRLYVKIEGLQKEMTKIVRKIALEKSVKPVKQVQETKGTTKAASVTNATSKTASTKKEKKQE